MDELEQLFAALQAEIVARDGKIAELEKENAELRSRLGTVKATPEPLKVYGSVEEIVWERGPHNANSYNLQLMLGSKHDLRPWLHVIVEGLGEVRRMNRAIMPDWYAIAHHRVLDVTANPWVCLVQAGDDSVEEDPADMRELVRNYSGGLRHSLSSWTAHQLGAELRAVYLETHDDPGIVDPSTHIPLAPTP